MTKMMTYAELEKAITRAHRSGEFRLVDELETEREFRKTAYRDRTDGLQFKGDNSRRSFKS